MLNIAVSDIMLMCLNKNTFDKGMNYYITGRVKDFNIDEDEDTVTVYANVKGENNNYYYTEIEFDEQDILEMRCECEAFDTYGGICKHLVATLLEYRRRYDRGILKGDTKNSDFIVDFLKHRMLNANENVEKEELNIDVCYEVKSNIGGEVVPAISLKVGNSKLYVVKDIIEFLEAYESKNKTIEFGKGFTFDPTAQKFNLEDEKIIELLLEIKDANDSLNRINRYGYSVVKIIDKKFAYVTKAQAEKFFQVVNDRTIGLKYYDMQYKDVKVINENMPLEFELITKKNKMCLVDKGDKFRPVPLTNGDVKFFLYQGNIYNISKEQKEIYYPFYERFLKSENNVIDFKQSEKDSVLSYIVPALEKISKKVYVEKEIVKDVHIEKLEPEIYLDKEDDKVVSTFKFKYGEDYINPLDDGKSNEILNLIRDVEGEMNIFSLFRGYGFKKERDSYGLEDEGNIVRFLSDGLEKLQEVAEVYYSDSFKNMKVYKSKNYKTSIALNNENLLEFSFSIDGVDQNELKDILNSLKQSKKFHKLKKGGYVDLQSDELNEFARMIDYLDIKESQLSNEKILLPRYNALYMENRLKNIKDMNIKRNRQFKELISTVSEVNDNDFDVPKHLEEIMRGYQKTGFKWFKTLTQYGFAGILADEMGLGKTLQTIAFIESEMQDSYKPCIVIAPSSLVYNWESEIEKFSNGLKTLVVAGNKNEREDMLKNLSEYDVIVTSYPLIRRDIDVYKDIEFKHCFLDEAQYIKNPNSINANTVKELKAEGHFALTGTPIENSLVELWSIFDFIMPGYLYTRNKFSKKFESPIYKEKSKDALKELYNKISPFILRRRKSDVIKELPPKIEHRVLVDMEEEQKKLYLAYLKAAKGEIDDVINSEGFSKSKLKILAVLTRLRQICCDPKSFMENYNGESAKISALADMLDDMMSDGHKILIFSQFTTVLKRIEEMIQSKEIKSMYLDGSTKIEDRLEMVKEFNEGDAKIFLISLKAGGTGLNLTGADTVIHFDPWWNPAVEDQATDRAHRIGQKKTVEVIKLITRGTIEEKICKLQEKKKEIVNDVIKDGENMLTALSEDDIKSLLE